MRARECVCVILLLLFFCFFVVAAVLFVSFLAVEVVLTSLLLPALQLDKGDYPENSHVVFCPNKVALF